MNYGKWLSANKKTALEFIQFSCVGIATTVIYTISVFIFSDIFIFPTYVAVSIAYFIATLFHFSLNNWFTFKHTDVQWSRLFKYLSLACGYYLVFLALTWMFIEFLKFSIILGSLLAIGFASILSFFFAKFWVFKLK